MIFLDWLKLKIQKQKNFFWKKGNQGILTVNVHLTWSSLAIWEAIFISPLGGMNASAINCENGLLRKSLPHVHANVDQPRSCIQFLGRVPLRHREENIPRPPRNSLICRCRASCISTPEPRNKKVHWYQDNNTHEIFKRKNCHFPNGPR